MADFCRKMRGFMETNVKNAKISVIVPVYNTPTLHLNRCINSLLQQDYTNTEIILVDDGSSRDCCAVLEQIATRDNRIHLFHKENGGVSSARNLGLSKVTGEFLTFMDSDDYLDSHAWSLCIGSMQSHDSDLVCFGWQDHLADGTLVDHCITQDYSMSTIAKHLEAMRHITPIEETLASGQKRVSLPRSKESNQPLVCDRETLLTEIASDNIHYGGGYPWNKIWRTSALRDADGSLPLYDESLTIYEDKLWVLEAGARISSALIMPHILYHYMFLPGSLTHKDTDIIDRQPLAYKAYDKILDFLEKDFPEAYIRAYNFYFDVIFDDIHVLKDARHRDHYQKQYTETMATYKRLCKRIAPRTLYYPVRSPQFCSWLKERTLP